MRPRVPTVACLRALAIALLAGSVSAGAAQGPGASAPQGPGAKGAQTVKRGGTGSPAKRPSAGSSAPHAAPAIRPGSAVRTTTAGRTAGGPAAGTTSIQGAAWHSDNSPIPQALLRLRNVTTGKIQATTIASDAGQFAFNGVPHGTYVIEMVTQSGKVMMVGHTFTVAPGETVATFVRLGPKVPWFNGFFGNAAQTISSSAASTGVTAVAPERIPPVSSAR